MRERTATRLAWGLWSLLLLSVVLIFVLFAINKRGIFAGVGDVTVFFALGTVGAMAAARRPGNILGWLLLGGALSALLFTGVASELAVLGLLTRPGSIPGAIWLAWISNWAWLLAYGPPLAFVPLLFPDGRLPSRRWKPYAWFVGVFLAFAAASFALLTTHYDPPLQRFESPVELRSLASLIRGFTHAGYPVLIGMVVVSSASLIVRYRRASGEERQQIKWFGLGVAVTAIAVVIGGILSGLGYSTLSNVIPTLGILGIPIGAGVAIFKYRLYDIDVVINKAVLYAVLAAFFTAVYVAVVVGIGAAVGSRANSFLTVAAAVILAVAFHPVRDRARHLANRIVYGNRATPYEVLSEFSERVAGTYAMDEVLPRMARLLGEGTGARRADVWLRVGSELKAAANWPPEIESRVSLPLSDGALPEFDGVDRAVPVRHQDVLLGALTVSKPPGDPLRPAEDKLLADLASQAGLVLRNVGLTAELQANLEELRASRQRLVAAQDEERRRLERNLHDGAQQQLVAIAIKQRLAEQLARKDPAKAAEILSQLQTDTADALENLRDLARGIYPPLLSDKGLIAALESQARKSAVAIVVEADGVGRYPQEQEAAVYFCVLEALQNVAKYAKANRTVVRLAAAHGSLTFEVEDDGAGFDPNATGYGTGLQGMADRLSALGGDLNIRSRLGAGTTVVGRLPVAETEG